MRIREIVFAEPKDDRGGLDFRFGAHENVRNQGQQIVTGEYPHER